MGKKNIAYINKEMLIWARMQTPFNSSPSDINKCFPKIDVEKVKKWENGELLPSIREAKELCKIYKVPFACLFLSSIPKRELKKYVDRRTFIGSEYSEMSYDLWKEIKRISNDRNVTLTYIDDADKLNGDLITVTKSDNISTISSKIRTYFNMPAYFKYKSEYGGNSFNFFRKLLENKNIIVAQISDVDLAEMKGLSIYEDKLPIIAINNKDYERAKTYSLFHELAHLVRRSSSICLIDDNERNDNEEKICDKIAAEVLMPKAEFSIIANSIYEKYNEWNKQSINSIADKFGVSIVSACRRLHDLNIISDSMYHDIYKVISEDFNKMLELKKKELTEKNVPYFFHVKYINAHGHIMPRAVISAFDSGKISLGEVCKTLNIKSKYINDITRAAML